MFAFFASVGDGSRDQPTLFPIQQNWKRTWGLSWKATYLLQDKHGMAALFQNSGTAFHVLLLLDILSAHGARCNFNSGQHKKKEDTYELVLVNGASRSVIILPKNNFNEGWLGLATKIEGFINGLNTQLALNTKETILHPDTQKGKGIIKKHYTGTDGLKKNKKYSRRNPEDIKKKIVVFYMGLYSGDLQVGARFMLQKEFEDQEIWDSAKLCASDKAPAPNGVTMAFYTHCWERVQDHLQNTHRENQNGYAQTGGPPQQLAFIKGRQIVDAILMANEYVNARTRSSVPGILCKLDIQKAYDHLNWKFLLETLSKRGFGSIWLRWMKFCISTVKFSVLINGSPTGFFSSQRGLRQGDPLSPFLFIIAMEGLNDMLKIAQEKLWLRGFKVSSRVGADMEITHLQYADDTLVFYDANRNQFKILRVIFVLFEAISGIHINWNNSFLYPVNEMKSLIPSLARILGGRTGDLPTTYLGMPLGSKSKSIGIWNGGMKWVMPKKVTQPLKIWSSYASITGDNEMENHFGLHLVEYMEDLESVTDVLGSLPDTVSWVHSEDGRFTFNKLYKKELETQQGLRLAGNMYGQAKHQPRSNVLYGWLTGNSWMMPGHTADSLSC
ncbi:hypothetical protein MTR67_005389 [Solanum verrucosum]|uniref:Reverse transcriptase domain-containing protein n=1 Tax=Solanum verrucosum TaxID=315347 RepID=A0AAF0Q200_SOLVR|nr:hypothetical protein MTR67_005389 [Solanum verrucosum]